MSVFECSSVLLLSSGEGLLCTIERTHSLYTEQNYFKVRDGNSIKPYSCFRLSTTMYSKTGLWPLSSRIVERCQHWPELLSLMRSFRATALDTMVMLAAAWLTLTHSRKKHPTAFAKSLNKTELYQNHTLESVQRQKALFRNTHYHRCLQNKWYHCLPVRRISTTKLFLVESVMMCSPQPQEYG